MDGYASEVSYFSTPSLLLLPQLILYVLVITALVYLIVAMKILGLRIVLISLLFGCICSGIFLLYLKVKYFFDGIDIAQMPLIPVFLWQFLFFTIVALYVLLLLQAKRENHREESRLKILGKHRTILQIVLILFTVSIFYLPILSNFFFTFSILLLCMGAFLYYRTKSKLSGSLILWGIAMLVLTYLMIFFAYGIENCIISKNVG